MNNSTNKPVDEIRLGSVKAAIWKNAVDQGASSRSIYSVTLQRLYRDGKGKWQSSESFGRDELLILSKVAERAFERIHELQQTGQASESRP